MIPITIALVVVQEMASRMGAVTGKGLSDLIREEFGFRVTFWLMLALVVTNFGNVVAEFAGVASSLELFGIVEVHRRAAGGGDRLAAGRAAAPTTASRRSSSPRPAFYVCYIIAGLLAHPDWKAAALATVSRAVGGRHPQLRLPVHGDRPGRHDDRAVDAVLPAGVDRRERDHRAAVRGVALGRDPRLPVHRHRRLVHHRRLRGDAVRDRTTATSSSAADAAQALRPLAGEYAYLLFAAGLFNASLFAASILPISTAYAVCEGLGFESGLDKKFHEAPVFYWLYTLLIVAGAGVLLVPRLPLVYVMVLSQVVNGVVLPFVLIFMLLLTNDRELMGEHVNSRGFNIIAWMTVVVMIVLTILMVLTQR